MKHIPEKLLHFIWKYQIYETGKLKTTSGEPIVVHHPGEYHSDAGPDFFNARIRINNTDWAGNVEIHVNASDWIRHGHQNDRAYDNVILHVVHFYDCEITDVHLKSIPTMVIPCPDKLINAYKDLMNSEKWLPCDDHIKNIAPINLHQWLTALTIERLGEKHLRLKSVLERTNNDWEQMLFVILASSFGIPVNQIPFEMLANSLDIRQVIRIKNDLFRTEAMLFGMAGFLTANLPFDYYTESLLREYLILKPRIEKNEVPYQIWKFLRLRPGSFPSVRLALLSALIHYKFPLSDAIIRICSIEGLHNLLKVRAGDYWNTHYLPGKLSPSKIKFTGKTFLDTIIINAVIPFLFTFGKLRGMPEKIELAIHLLEEIAAEKNVITQNWGKFGIIAKNAFESQALIQLNKNYCRQKRCLECQIGLKIIPPQPDEGP